LAVPSNYWQAHDPFPYDPGFNITKVAEVAESLPSHSWEYGTASEALLEIHNPEISVFGRSPFPVRTRFPENVRSLAYAAAKIVIGTGPNSLVNGDGAVGDPASLGISAYLLGKTNQTYSAAATSELDYVVYGAPRFWNGAISHRVSVAELWYMSLPLLTLRELFLNKLPLGPISCIWLHRSSRITVQRPIMHPCSARLPTNSSSIVKFCRQILPRHTKGFGTISSVPIARILDSGRQAMAGQLQGQLASSRPS